MPLIAPARLKVDPNFTDPRVLVHYAQRSGFAELFPGGEPAVRLGERDFAVYVPVMNMRTIAKGAQSGYNELPSVSLVADTITTPTYEQKIRVEYSREDLNAAGNWGLSLAQAYSTGMRQGHFQLLRDAALFGFNPQNGEGLLNAQQGTVRDNLPADSKGNTTLDAYDAGELYQFLLHLIQSQLVRCNLTQPSGQYNVGGEPVKVRLLMPQRILALLTTKIVQLTSYQRIGAGTQSVMQAVIETMKAANVDVLAAPDDELMGRGANGTDAVIATIPELPKRDGLLTFDTNAFGDEFGQSNTDCNALYVDRSVPAEITGPIGAEATDVVSFMRTTSGWALRGEATTILSVPVSTSGVFSSAH